MRLELLYRIRFTYPEGWMVELDGGWQQHLYLAEGRCDGVISGRFRGANAPLRQGAAGPFRPDIREVIEADDGSTIMLGASRKRRQEKEMAARSARLLSDQRRAAGARDHRCEAEFAASDSYRGPHDNHVLRTSV